MQNYNTVPAMISEKDLDYLTDIFNWNFSACKQALHFIKNVKDEEIKEVLNLAYLMHLENSRQVLEILK